MKNLLSLNCQQIHQNTWTYFVRLQKKEGLTVSDSDYKSAGRFTRAHLSELKKSCSCSRPRLRRDLTIRQRRRPWKRRWKIDFAFVLTFSRLSKVALLLKRGEFRLDLKTGDCSRVQTEIVKYIAFPFPFSSKLNIWSFHVVVVQGQQGNVQKSVMHVQSCFFFCLLNLLLFWSSPCRRRRCFVMSQESKDRALVKVEKFYKRLWYYL